MILSRTLPALAACLATCLSGAAVRPFGGAALAASAPAAILSTADQALIARARASLQALSQVKGRFIQTDPRGQTSSGDLYIQRPGKARFAYDPPKGLLIVSDGRLVSVYDGRLKTFNNYPLGSTPLALILARDIRLGAGVEVSAVTRTADGFAITARDARGKMRGIVTLTFADGPLRLVEWSVTDAQGARTRVRLSGLAPAPALDPALFVLRSPMRPRA